jgi:membrane protein DedA with SNARE-associated domain
MNIVVSGVMLAGATLISEDAATVAAGSLVALKQMPPAAAVFWVATGIWIGDLALFAIGRSARRWRPVERWVARRWSPDRLSGMEGRINRSAALAILGSRFMPGTRVVLYVAAGLLHVRLSTFALSAAVASLVWTSTIVTAIGAVGRL